MNEFPGYKLWTAMLAERDLAMLNIFASAGLALLYLLYAKYQAPRLLPMVRIGCLILFYGSLFYKIAKNLLRG